MKYYAIASPTFSVTSGGVRVMYGLYGALLAKGQVAFMNQYPTNHDFVAVYPEIVTGNPFNAKHVVRYILNKAGVVSAVDMNGVATRGPEKFDETDTLYYFSRLFGEAKDEDHYMFLPILDMHVFKDQGKPRTKRAVFVGKGTDGGKHPKGCILIDRQLAENQQALADLLNECQVLYCYDPVTAMTEIARLCGCRVVMYNSEYSLSEFQKYEPSMDGISWQSDQGKEFDPTVFAVRYNLMKEKFWRQLDKFIDETQAL